MKLIVRGLINLIAYIYKNTGINGILVLILIVELPCCLYYFYEVSSTYSIDDNLQLMQVKNFTPVSYEELPESTKEYYSDYQLYYHANVEIGNYYNADDNIPNLSAQDQNGESLHANYYDYYDGYNEPGSFPKLDGRTVIPPGTSVIVPYLFEIGDYEKEEIKNITFYFYDAQYETKNVEEQINRGMRITTPFTP